jgi:fatty-acid desaturase
MITEQTIILAIIGMVGLFSSAIVWQRANKITHKYYDTSTDKRVN